MPLYEPIPQPRRDPIVGHIRAIGPRTPIQAMMHIAKKMGPLFALDMLRHRLVVASSQPLVHELCDEQRFGKAVHPVLVSLRDLGGDGLFTARTSEPNWGKAHRILMPAFGPMGVRDMFDQMVDIADQMLLRWERFGSGVRLDVADQMTRLTLDTIALCAFGYRFNSFYRERMHPFIDAMAAGLEETSSRTQRLPGTKWLLRARERSYWSNVRVMHQVADELIAERKRLGEAGERNDLLQRMLAAVDPVSGERLSDENIRYQMVTFLIAGHETTSGLLSFALHLLTAHPQILAKAQAVVDEVLGSELPRAQDLPELRYLEQVLLESLRLWPTAPAFGVRCKEPTTLAGRHVISPHDTLLVLLPMLHRDPAVWGQDVLEFRPERFERALEQALPPDAFKPFGTGQRACIGRAFAMQEALLVLAMVLQRFDLQPADPNYELRIKETLTLKPEGFEMYAIARSKPRKSTRSAISAPATVQVEAGGRPTQLPALTTPLLVLYGSNAGTAQTLAERIAADGATRGYATRVATLDAYAGHLPREGAVLVVTASYEGEPPDNARAFVEDLVQQPTGALDGVRFGVFGCGDRQWAHTYQAVPTRIDEGLVAAGADRVVPRGEADASGDFLGDFETWYAAVWETLGEALGHDVQGAANDPAGSAGVGLSIELLPVARATQLRMPDVQGALLLENRSLLGSSPGWVAPRDKRHLDFELPAGMSYRTGDYLAVLPRNPPQTVQRVLKRFGLSADDQVLVRATAAQGVGLPQGYPLAAGELLGSYVELGQPATRPQLRKLLQHTGCPQAQADLQHLLDPAHYRAQVLERRLSVLDLLERFTACTLPLADYLGLLPPLRARQYSISSSPLAGANTCALTVSVAQGQALSGQGPFIGVASNYLAGSEPGSRLPVAVRPGNEHFRPPADPTVPMILVAAGSGLAPFRGFLQERALQKADGMAVAESLLFFGCDHPDVDYLYREELAAWADQGVVRLLPAFAEQPQGEVRYVQHRLWQERSLVLGCFDRGATIFVCGDGQAMGPAVRKTLQTIFREGRAQPEAFATEVEQQHRLVQDLFA